MPTPPPGQASPVLSPTAVVAGRYRITGPLSGGGGNTAFATYEALDLKADAAEAEGGAGDGLPYVVLRVMTDRSVGPPTDAERSHLAQQAAGLRRVRHPAVARTIELSLHGELGLFLAREPIERDGQTLRELLTSRGGPLPEAEAIKLCAQIGEALEAVHQQGACHLSLSPSCVYVYPDGPEVRVKVVDFGLLPPSWAAQLGEAGYLAPEQVSGQLGGPPDAQSCDRRTDQFALAVILYEMLAGQPAFIAAADEDRQIILNRVRNEDPLPLSQSRPVEQALARALSRSRGVRFPSIRDFMQALGADVSAWPLRPALGPAVVTAPPSRTPRLLLPMIAGAVFSLVGLSAVGGLQRLTQKPVQGLFSAWWPRSSTPAEPRPPGRASRPSPTVGTEPPSSGTPTPSPVSGPVNETDAADLHPAAPVLPTLPVANANHSDIHNDNGDGGDSVPDGMAGGTEDPLRGAAGRGEELAHGGIRKPVPVSPGAGIGVQGAAGPLALAFSGPEAEALTKEQRGELTRCVKMVSPRFPFSIALQNINGVFYVDPSRTSAELNNSQDFRDCLKLSVKGKIVPKVLTITKMLKGKAAQ